VKRLRLLRAAGPATWMRGLGAYDGLLCAVRAARAAGLHDEFWVAYRRLRKRLDVERATAEAAAEIHVTPIHQVASNAE
jgi:hypothetical protein